MCRFQYTAIMAGIPHVAYANWYQFMPGEQVDNPRVESRMLLWSRSGSGKVWVDEREYPLNPGDFLLLPWGHHIRYHAARSQPFLLGGAHLICQVSGVFHFGVAHTREHALAGTDQRSDDSTLISPLLAGHLDDHPGLGPLAEHLAHTWAKRQPTSDLAQAQGLMLRQALRDVIAAPTPTDVSGELQRLTAAVQRHLDRAWDLTRMAETAGCSSAWLTRLARRYWRTSPCRWLHRQRLEHARHLLRSGTQSVADIAAAVGIPDRHRFSRAFHSAFGAPPRRWRCAHRGP